MAATPSHYNVVSHLEGNACQHCDSGELVAGEHKGSTAVVCSSCEVPQVRFS